ncbi:MAG: hypothetical protein K8I60_19670 [Anaerolineae bacterium]|nr:hypothetical protein [Anaerolineae bacterium]
MNTTEERKRGIALTIWLVLMILLNLYSFSTNWALRQDWIDHGLNEAFNRSTPEIIPLLYVILPLVNIASAALVWFWKKIGLYLFVLSTGIVFVLNLSLGIPIGFALFGLVGMVILYVLMRPRWQWFE